MSFLSCDDESLVPAGDQLVPLAIGNRWIGRVTTEGYGSPPEYFDTIEIVDMVHNPGEVPETIYVDNRGWRHYHIGREYYIENCSDRQTRMPAWAIAQCRPIGLYPTFRGEVFGEGIPDTVWVPNSADPGAGPIALEFPAVMATGVIELPVKTDAGTFDCLYFTKRWLPSEEKNRETFDFMALFAPGVGLVMYHDPRYGNHPQPLECVDCFDFSYTWKLVDVQLH